MIRRAGLRVYISPRTLRRDMVAFLCTWDVEAFDDRGAVLKVPSHYLPGGIGIRMTPAPDYEIDFDGTLRASLTNGNRDRPLARWPFYVESPMQFQLIASIDNRMLFLIDQQFRPGLQYFGGQQRRGFEQEVAPLPEPADFQTQLKVERKKRAHLWDIVSIARAFGRKKR
jgi:hypothetical protein